MSQTKKLILLLGILFVCSFAAAQNPSVYQNIVFNRQGQPLAGATVYICLSDPGTTNIGCNDKATTFSDITVSTQCVGTNTLTYGPGCSNPGLTDGFGNYIIYADAGQILWAQISGPKISTYTVPFVMPGTASGGGGAVGPGSVGLFPIFTSTTSIGNSVCSQRTAGDVGCAFGFSLETNALRTSKNRNSPVGTTANLLVAFDAAGLAINAQPTDTNNLKGIAISTGVGGGVDIAYSRPVPLPVRQSDGNWRLGCTWLGLAVS